MSAPTQDAVDVTPADYHLAVRQAATFAAKAVDRNESTDSRQTAAVLALAAEVRALRVGLLGAEVPRGGLFARLLRVLK